MKTVETVCLLASSATVEGIQDMINRFWCSTAYRVDPETLVISHPDRSAPDHVRVERKGKRLRFVSVRKEST
jgi:hypothetical protein